MFSVLPFSIFTCRINDFITGNVIKGYISTDGSTYPNDKVLDGQSVTCRPLIGNNPATIVIELKRQYRIVGLTLHIPADVIGKRGLYTG